MRSKLFGSMFALFVALALAVIPTAMGAKPKPGQLYPHNYKGLIKLHVEGAKAVIPGKTTVIVMKVTNTSSEDILSNDITLTLDNAADGVLPFTSANVAKWSPAVDFLKAGNQVYSDEWITGALLKGQSKTWHVRVKIPKNVPNSATRWCFAGWVSMSSYGPAGISGWSDAADDGTDVCPKIWRRR